MTSCLFCSDRLLANISIELYLRPVDPWKSEGSPTLTSVGLTIDSPWVSRGSCLRIVGLVGREKVPERCTPPIENG